MFALSHQQTLVPFLPGRRPPAQEAKVCKLGTSKGPTPISGDPGVQQVTSTRQIEARAVGCPHSPSPPCQIQHHSSENRSHLCGTLATYLTLTHPRGYRKQLFRCCFTFGFGSNTWCPNGTFWKQTLKPAVCPSFILSHTHLANLQTSAIGLYFPAFGCC